MPSTMMHGKSGITGRAQAGAGLGLDSDVEAYFSDLDRESLMDAAQERLAAERILRLRREYWARLLGYPPFLDAMLATIEAALAAHGRKARAMAEMLRVAEALRGRPRQRERERADAAREALAQELADLDPSIELADRLFADLESIDAGQAREAGLAVRAPARGSVTFRSYLHGVRSARMALCAARHELVRANLRLVVTMAHRYRRNGRMPLADLIQEGNMGLLTAVDRFDPRKGFRFSTYGSWWIRHAIGRALSDKGRAVRLPVHVVELQHKLARVRRALEVELGRAPERAELAAALGVPELKLERLDRALIREGSPDAPPGEATSGIEVLPDEGPGADRLLHDGRLDEALNEALSTLRPMEADILRHRFGLDDGNAMTLREVGELHGLSRERIRQLQERALEKIRAELRHRGFDMQSGAMA
jgi:RNA polymerase primary sigma factor